MRGSPVLSETARDSDGYGTPSWELYLPWICAFIVNCIYSSSIRPIVELRSNIK